MKLKYHIYAQWNKYTKEFQYSVGGGDMSEYGYKTLETREVEFETPEEAVLRQGAYTILMKRAQGIRARAEVEAQEFEEEAQKLLCLDYTPNDSDIPF